MADSEQTRTNHTPGPWVVYTPEDYAGPTELPGLGVESKTGEAVVWAALDAETGLKNDGDAALIAAAPDLYEAVEAFVNANITVGSREGLNPEYIEAEKIALVALAKAEGRNTGGDHE